MRSRDSVAFTLSRPHINEPGMVFGYSGGYVTVVGEIIKNATGSESVLHYLNNGPLGKLAFENHSWLTQRDGRQNTAGGVQLRPRDLAKIGLMVLNGGDWQGERLVPADWIRDSLSLQIPGASSNWNEYGYLWWGRDYEAAGRTYHADSAQGLGGQELILIDELDLVVVITANNYDTVPLTESFMTNLVIPALN